MTARIQALGSGLYRGPKCGQDRREHDSEKLGARNVAMTEARARFREAKSILIGKNSGIPMTDRIQILNASRVPTSPPETSSAAVNTFAIRV